MPRKGKAKTRADLSTNQIKLGFWTHLLNTGFVVTAPTNCLRRRDPNGLPDRYNFQHDTILRHEQKKQLSEEEIATLKSGGQVSRWEVTDEAPYEKMIIGDDDVLVFPKVEKESN